MSQRFLALACALLTVLVGAARASDRPGAVDDGARLHGGKLDAALLTRAQIDRSQTPTAADLRHPLQALQPLSRVIIRTRDGRPATSLVKAVNGLAGRYFSWLGGQAALVPDAALAWLASQPEVAAISLDRAVRGTMERTAAVIGARWVTEQLGVDGSGIGVATIDSGVNPWHEDLDGRVVHFADFVNALALPYDDYGHGTHVAGIIAGSGHDSGGVRRGIAPGAHLVVLKALDTTGDGFTSNVIAAIDYAIANRATYNIRVLNLSVAAGVYESYLRDPLTLAAKRAVDAGIVVVAAAGNRGRGPAGRALYGAIASPGNAPWVITVGAASDLGTVDRRDDVVAGFSSRGPAEIDANAKPDLVAPGVGIESTADPSSALYAANPSARIWGSAWTSSEPYLSLTGTSMAAPVVTGAVALMLQANAALTPNAVKAILEYTAETHDAYDYLTQGAGFLNARGAVELARTFSAPESRRLATDPVRWSGHIIWGNLRIGGVRLDANANAWARGVTWGDSQTPKGDAIGWGAACHESEPGCEDGAGKAGCDVLGPDCVLFDASIADLTSDDISTPPLTEEPICQAEGCDVPGVPRTLGILDPPLWSAGDEDNRLGLYRPIFSREQSRPWIGIEKAHG